MGNIHELVLEAQNAPLFRRTQNAERRTAAPELVTLDGSAETALDLMGTETDRNRQKPTETELTGYPNQH